MCVRMKLAGCKKVSVGICMRVLHGRHNASSEIDEGPLYLADFPPLAAERERRQRRTAALCKHPNNTTAKRERERERESAHVPDQLHTSKIRMIPWREDATGQKMQSAKERRMYSVPSTFWRLRKALWGRFSAPFL